MSAGIFITGTDTGVGKTFFASSLAASFRQRGYRIGVMKPVETGCAERDGILFPDDAAQLKAASGCLEPLETVCPYRFAEPLAPSIAAERAGRMVEIDHLLAVYQSISSAHDLTLVEGAGGLMVPLLPSYTYADLARVMKLPLLAVAANRLGMINHLLLTLEHASCKGLQVLGYVLNRVTAETSLPMETNREVMSGLTGVSCLGNFPFVDGDETQTFPLEVFEAEFDFSSIQMLLP